MPFRLSIADLKFWGVKVVVLNILLLPFILLVTHWMKQLQAKTCYFCFFYVSGLFCYDFYFVLASVTKKETNNLIT
jgi:hypothetical protein